MRKEDWSIEKQFDLVLKKLAQKLRATNQDNLTPELVSAAARLLGKFNEFLRIKNEIGDGESDNDWYSKLESGEATEIDWEKYEKPKKIIRRKKVKI